MIKLIKGRLYLFGEKVIVQYKLKTQGFTPCVFLCLFLKMRLF